MQDSTADTRFWDRVAQKYARAAIRDMPGYERTLARTAQLLRTTDAVLEIGCGTATTALRLAPMVRHILATDVSSEMIAIARQKATAAGCGNVELRAGDIASLQEPDGSFDTVLAFNILHLVRDRGAALERVRRLLKPGGLLITKTPCLSEMNLLIRLAVPLAQRFGKAPWVSFLSAPRLEAEIAAAGFTIIEQARHGSKRKDPRIFIVARSPALAQTPAGDTVNDGDAART
jgi:ubiquinone/menaquinone biosynthesis C-methylase UbiE